MWGKTKGIYLCCFDFSVYSFHQQIFNYYYPYCLLVSLCHGNIYLDEKKVGNRLSLLSMEYKDDFAKYNQELQYQTQPR